jgi:hypothetical protein
MRLANTLGIVMNQMYYHNRPKPALVYFIQSRLIVAGWVVWNGGFDYRSRKQREMTHPSREHIDKVLENYYEKHNRSGDPL